MSHICDAVEAYYVWGWSGVDSEATLNMYVFVRSIRAIPKTINR